MVLYSNQWRLTKDTQTINLLRYKYVAKNWSVLANIFSASDDLSLIIIIFTPIQGSTFLLDIWGKYFGKSPVDPDNLVKSGYFSIS